MGTVTSRVTSHRAVPGGSHGLGTALGAEEAGLPGNRFPASEGCRQVGAADLDPGVAEGFAGDDPAGAGWHVQPVKLGGQLASAVTRTGCDLVAEGLEVAAQPDMRVAVVVAFFLPVKAEGQLGCLRQQPFGVDVAFLRRRSTGAAGHVLARMVEAQQRYPAGAERDDGVPVERQVGVGLVFLPGHHAGSGVDDDNGGAVGDGQGEDLLAAHAGVERGDGRE